MFPSSANASGVIHPPCGLTMKSGALVVWSTRSERHQAAAADRATTRHAGQEPGDVGCGYAVSDTGMKDRMTPGVIL